MRIAQIAPIIERVPPKKYGGTERVVYHLTEQLVKKGHQVTLFASGDSITSAKLISIYPKALKETDFKDIYGQNCYTMLNIGQAYQMQDQFDVIHDHNGYFSLPAANMAKTPVVMTYHGPITPEVRYVHQILNKPYLVSISESQAKPAPDLNWAGTVYNGLDMDRYPFSDTHEGYLLFVGRISKEKGVHIAVQVAKKLDMPLIIAAKLETAYKPDVEYYKKHVEPFLSDKIKWIGEVDETERNALMTKAKAFLHPVTWPEPFGLTLIESMACGCPVIAFSLGSIPEVIADGKTGFVVNTFDEMVEAVRKIDQIKRSDCRIYSLGKFHAENMVEGYLKIYQKIINEKKQAEAREQLIAPVIPNFIVPKQYGSRSFTSTFAHDLRLQPIKPLKGKNPTRRN